MKTNKIVFLLAFGLICSLGMAQGSDRARSGFQGLWQERSGHSLHLDYGFFLGKWDAKIAATRLPLRFDLDYQYDIPWRFKRTNFFAETGLGYMWGRTDTAFGYENKIRTERDVYHRVAWHLGVGLKVHCTDWLYLSFGGGFKVGYGYHASEVKMFPLSSVNKYEDRWLDIIHRVSWGGYSAAGIVGQIRQFSISLGYRADHWVNPDFRFNAETRRWGHTDWFITLGLGYHF
ncbi:MAG: hypothetical protein K2H70_04480 [Bacteroidales bacterium]|nr:hypothetical protein [Bacteroidales bacterium]